MKDVFRIGRIKVSRVEEWQGGFSLPEHLFSGFSPDDWEPLRQEFIPQYLEAQSGKLYAFLQSWVLDTGQRRILFDTGAGNDKLRPNLPVFSELNTDFLENLARAGYQPQDIDLVVCSHIHVDHVGWNTRLVDGRWEPTFRNAQYVLPLADRDYWDPMFGARGPGEIGRTVNDGMFEDSVRPLIDRDLVAWADEGFQIDDGISLHGYPGHTPGSMVMQLQSGDEHALFVGDLVHHPAQIHQPEWNSVFCEDSERARVSRRRMLELAAHTGALVIPAHFGGAHRVRVARRGQGFRPVYLD